MQGVTPYLLLAMLGAAIAGAGFAAAGAGDTAAPSNPDLGFYLMAKERSGELADPALTLAAGIPDQPGRERALVYAALRDLARSAGIPSAAETGIAALETVRSSVPVPAVP